MKTPKINKHIEILRTTVEKFSSLSLRSAQAMEVTLGKYYQEVNISTVDTEADLEQLVRKQPDLVFMGMGQMVGSGGGRIWLSTYLEDRGITHTGSSQSALEYENNKAFAKQRILDEGLKTSPFFVIKNGIPYLDTSMLLKFPLFVKPTSMGGGEGVDKNSVVHNFADLRTKSTALATDLASDSLVEEYLSGREFSVAILEAKLTNEPLAMPLEIVTASNSRGDRILSQAVKADNHESVLPVTDPLIRAKLTTMAMDVFFALGATGYGRIDIRLDSHGVPHFLEANLIPSLIDTYGNFPKACILNIGLGYDDMLLRIVDLGFANQPRAHSALLAA